jgi:hypothetical protein
MNELIKETKDYAQIITVLWSLLFLTVMVGTKYTILEGFIRYFLLLVLAVAFLLYVMIVFG